MRKEKHAVRRIVEDSALGLVLGLVLVLLPLLPLLPLLCKPTKKKSLIACKPEKRNSTGMYRPTHEVCAKFTASYAPTRMGLNKLMNE